MEKIVHWGEWKMSQESDCSKHQHVQWFQVGRRWPIDRLKLDGEKIK